MYLFTDALVCTKAVRNFKNTEMLGEYSYVPKVKDGAGWGRMGVGISIV